MKLVSPLLFAAALLGSTAAQAACTSLTEGEFRELVARSQASLDADDMVGHTAIFKEVKARIPCFEGQVPRDSWSQLLLGTALIEYALDKDWPAPLDGALRAYPEVDRSATPQAIRSHPQPPPLTPSSGELVPGAIYFVDGQVITFVPELTGIHIVQRVDGDSWESMFLDGMPFPSTWVDSAPTAVDPVIEEPMTERSPAVDDPPLVPADPPGVDTPSTSRRRIRVPLVVAGGIAAGLGAAGGVGTFAYGNGGTVFSESEANGIIAANTAAWAVAGVGVGVGVLGMVFRAPAKTTQLTVAPGHMGLRGSF